MPSGEPLVIVCVPSLVATLLSKEREKGSTLTEEEVLAIRDAAPAIAMPLPAAKAVADSRGYDDIDPERCWEEWQRVRLEHCEDWRLAGQ